jgi:Voltage-dependent anion channel
LSNYAERDEASARDIEPTPDVFATVMATGIVSIAARDHHYSKLSDALGVLATLGFAVLVAVVIAAAAARSRKLFWDLTDPDVTLRLFTFVAAGADRHHRHLGSGHVVDTSADVLRIAPHHPAP